MQLKTSLQEAFPQQVLQTGLPQLFSLGLLVVFSVYDSKTLPVSRINMSNQLLRGKESSPWQ